MKVKKAMKKSERQIWKSRMMGKSVLGLYRERKTELAREPFFDNTKESSLLLEARAETLKTKEYREKFEESKATCSTCGEETEMATHRTSECKITLPCVSR